jgi:hypothetical protein
MPCSLWARVRVPGASAAAIMAIPCQMSAERAARPATLYLVSEGGSVGVCLSRLLAEDFGRDTVCDLTKLEIPGLPVGRFVQLYLKLVKGVARDILSRWWPQLR